MTRKLKLGIAITVFSMILFLLIMVPAAIISYETDGMIYSDLTAVPHHTVGLVLGCPKKLVGGGDNIFFANRISAAVSLFRAGKVDYLLVSGDNISRGCNETTSMKEALLQAGIPADRIYCDFRGMRTLDSVVRTKEIFGQDEFLIISQEFHNSRALFIASHRGIKAVGFNAEGVPASESFMTSSRELFSKSLAVLDVYLFHSGPKFSGEMIPVGKADAAGGSCSHL
jgi:SanA protein